MKKGSRVFTLLTIFSLALFLPFFIVKGEGKLSEGEIKQKINTLQIPFIANEGQTDERVGFYAHISGGSVFVTKEGEIVYSLPDLRDTKSNYSSRHGHSSQDNPSIAGYILHDTPCNFNILHRTSYQNCSCYYLKRPNTHSENESSGKGLALKEQIIGGKVAQVKGEGRAVTQVNYFQGKDASQWKHNIPTYETVNLGEVYEGIELRLKAYGNNVEKLFYVKPGADPGQIKVGLSGVQPSKRMERQPPESPFSKGDDCKIPLNKGGEGVVLCGNEHVTSDSLDFAENAQSGEKGARGLSVNEHGELEVETEFGPVKFTKPVAYQEIEGKRVEVAVEYHIQKSGDRSQKTEEKAFQLTTPNPSTPQLIYGFTIASYDTSKELIIDPLLASTYLGGSGYDNVPSIAIDSSGNIYVAGHTTSSNFPTTAYVHNIPGGYNFTFVLKFNSDLTTILVSTYIAGSADDNKPSIAIDSDGNICVAGTTTFPEGYNTFISKLNSDLTSLLAFTYLPGGYNPSIATDSGGNIYVAGQTGSTNFPTTTGAYDTSFNGSYFDIYVSKHNSELTSLLASTYLGGSITDYASSIAIDSDGNVYVAGYTWSSNFPTTASAYDTSVDTSLNGVPDIFIAKLDSNLSAPDTTSPIVGATNPISNATDVAINTVITATFSEMMDASTITTATFTVNDGNSNIIGTISYTGTTATFTPSNDLSYSTTYTATITTGVKDISGNALSSDYSWSFATGQNPNTAPVANAGTDQSVHVGNTVTLDGSGSSDPDGDLLTYNWAFISKPGGSSATLSDPTLVNPTFTVDKAGTYELNLIVNDGTVDSTENTVMISTINVKPVAHAGSDQSVYVGNVVTLDGSGSSDPDGDQLTYSWTFQSKPQNSTAALNNPTSASPTFTVDKAGTYVVSLTVNDGALDSDPDTVTISNINVAPVADAGMDQAITVIGTNVQLDGTQSYDPDGDPITYQWAFTSKPGGSTASLANADTDTPTFTADVHGEYVVQLVVNDGSIPSSLDTVVVSFTNIKPVANAGTSQSAVVGDTVTINGSGSTDGNGDSLSYAWTFSSIPGGSNAELINPTVVITTFVPDKPGTYIVQLVVNDGIIDSDPGTVQVQVIDVQTAAIQAIQDCEGVIASLNSSVFKNVNMQNTLINKLNAVIANIEVGNYQDALGQLQNDILGKTDGCADSGSPDKNDWLKDCAAQGSVYSYIQHAIMVVEGLIASN